MSDITENAPAPIDDTTDIEGPVTESRNNESVNTDVTPEGSDSESDPDTHDDEHPANDDAGLSRRDRRYREQLRAAEADRDTLRNNLEAMQRREVERLAAQHLTKPAALWTVGVELENLLGDDGTVDPERVLAAAQNARQELGLEDPKAKLRRGPVVPREGTTVQSGGKSSSWSDAFKM